MVATDSNAMPLTHLSNSLSQLASSQRSLPLTRGFLTGARSLPSCCSRTCLLRLLTLKERRRARVGDG